MATLRNRNSKWHVQVRRSGHPPRKGPEPCGTSAKLAFCDRTKANPLMEPMNVSGARFKTRLEDGPKPAGSGPDSPSTAIFATLPVTAIGHPGNLS